MNRRLTAWETLLQSQIIHPDWTAKDHVEFLNQEGYDLDKTVQGWGTALSWVTHWMRDNERQGRIPAPRPQLRIVKNDE